MNHPKAFIDQLEHHLWAPIQSHSNGGNEVGARSQSVAPNVYAILDGARDKRIEPMINNGSLENMCLYKGKLSYAMKRAAPHIVSLEKGHPETRKILDMGWGSAWGIFMICAPDVSMTAVANNCRRISKAQLPDGKVVVFRYYDPRVLGPLMPTCDKEQLQALFGNAAKISFTSPCSNFLMVYSVRNSSLVMNEISIFKPLLEA